MDHYRLIRDQIVKTNHVGGVVSTEIDSLDEPTVRLLIHLIEDFGAEIVGCNTPDTKFIPRSPNWILERPMPKTWSRLKARRMALEEMIGLEEL